MGYSLVFTTVFAFTAQVVFGLYEFITFLFCQTLTCFQLYVLSAKLPFITIPRDIIVVIPVLKI